MAPGRGPFGIGGHTFRRDTVAGRAHTDLQEPTSVSQRSPVHVAAPFGHRCRYRVAGVSRRPADAPGRRVGHRVQRARGRRHIRPGVPEGTVRAVPLLHVVPDRSRCAVDNRTAVFVRPPRPPPPSDRRRRRVRRSHGSVGRSAVHGHRRCGLRVAQGVEARALQRRAGRVRRVFRRPDVRLGLGRGPATVAGVRCRKTAGRRAGRVQLRRADAADRRRPTRGSRAGGRRPHRGRGVRVRVADFILPRDPERVHRHGRRAGHAVRRADRPEKMDDVHAVHVRVQEEIRVPVVMTI